MSEWKIYHNPNCSKSRECLAYLVNSQIDVLVFEYLSSPLHLDQLNSLAQKLALRPKDFVRKGEAIFANLNISLENDEALFQAICQNPILLERPIIEFKNKAIVGRPTEKLKTFVAENVAKD